MHLYIFAVLASLSLLASCGTKDAASFNSRSGARETILVPVEGVKDSTIAVSLSVAFANYPDARQTGLLYYRLRPVIVETLESQSSQWDLTRKDILPYYSQIFCQDMRKNLGKSFERDPLTDCAVLKIERRRIDTS